MRGAPRERPLIIIGFGFSFSQLMIRASTQRVFGGMNRPPRRNEYWQLRTSTAHLHPSGKLEASSDLAQHCLRPRSNREELLNCLTAEVVEFVGRRRTYEYELSRGPPEPRTPSKPLVLKGFGGPGAPGTIHIHMFGGTKFGPGNRLLIFVDRNRDRPAGSSSDGPEHELPHKANEPM